MTHPHRNGKYGPLAVAGSLVALLVAGCEPSTSTQPAPPPTAPSLGKDTSAADNAPLQLWTYSNGNNQQWQPVAEADGYFHFVSRHSGKCLSVVGAADSAQLVQLACNNGAAQSFRVSP